MADTPDIIMRCPKCSKEFPLDSVYCEACSAMLEPEEVKEKPPSPKKEGARIHIRLSEQAASSSAERMDEARISTLKTEIEAKFIFTLLQELDQVRKRLSEKEKDLSDLQAQAPKSQTTGFIKKVGIKEKEIEDTVLRLTRLEATLENLKDKVAAEIAELTSTVGKLEAPGFFWFASKQGRYRKTVFSELKVKTKLQDIIMGRKSRHYFIRVSFVRRLTLSVLLVLIAIVVTWYFSRTVEERSPKVVEQQQTAPAEEAISAKDIQDLIEDIRQANMRKDLDLWASRYSRAYLATGNKKEDILNKWKNVDYIDLKYNLSEVKTEKATASAIVWWDMDLVMKNTGTRQKVTQALKADFAKEDGRLKITAVQKQ